MCTIKQSVASAVSRKNKVTDGCFSLSGDGATGRARPVEPLKMHRTILRSMPVGACRTAVIGCFPTILPTVADVSIAGRSCQDQVGDGGDYTFNSRLLSIESMPGGSKYAERTRNSVETPLKWVMLLSQRGYEPHSAHDTFFVALSAHCNSACLLLRIHVA